jgi:hypothetical protein
LYFEVSTGAGAETVAMLVMPFAVALVKITVAAVLEWLAEKSYNGLTVEGDVAAVLLIVKVPEPVTT